MFGHSGQNRNTGKKVEGIGGTQLNSNRMVDPSGGRPNIKAAIKFWKPRRGLRLQATWPERNPHRAQPALETRPPLTSYKPTYDAKLRARA